GWLRSSPRAPARASGASGLGVRQQDAVSAREASRPPSRPQLPAALTARHWVRRLNGLRGGHRGLWIALTAVLVLGGTIASVLGARAVASSETQKARLASPLASTRIAATLKLAIQHEEDLVIGASAYVSGNPR